MSGELSALGFNPNRFLAWLFHETEKAGFGIADGASFEAFPGCEDAAADYMEGLLSHD
ncbi:hypothetical protein [Nocardia vulneris]|uniref:hypothetical protein n=1 Tax=Nocardia vulneris TaxID=1141657 RepID=UPI000B306BA1|nr:hypothetical protein [Nocardia vulneris]